MLKNLQNTFCRINKYGWFLILIGSTSWLITVVKSGVMLKFGYGFWGANGHDGVWHIALIESLSKGTLQNPVYAGADIQNYHLGFDILVSIIHKLTFIPVFVLYFQIVPIFLAFGVGISSYLLVLRITGSKTKAFWSTFFIYFGGSFGWILTLARTNQLGGESIFWSQQAISTLINPPFALSLIITFVGLSLLVSGFENNNSKYLKISSLLFSLLIIVKIYASVVILFSLFIVSISEVLFRRNTKFLRYFGSTFIFSLILLIPFITDYSVLKIDPGWFLESMMAFSDRIGWDRYNSAMANYVLAGDWLKALLAYKVALIIFIVGNFGTRLIAISLFFRWIFKSRSYNPFGLLFASIVLSGVVVPMIFVQEGTPWNTIQFMYYSLSFAGIYAGIFMGSIFDDIQLAKHKLYKYVSVIFVVMITIPTTYSTLKYNYIPGRPPAMISKNELDALNFLSERADGVVLTYPFDKQLSEKAIMNPPRPLHLYESTAYVSAFSRKFVYLEDEVNLNITGYDWQSRRSEALKFFQTSDYFDQVKFVEFNNIKYIYLINHQIDEVHIPDIFEIIYKNDEVTVFEKNDY